jgi:hypothetical protein
VGTNIWFAYGDVINVYHPPFYLYRVAGSSDDAFDVINTPAGWRVKDNDVTHFGFTETVENLVDQQPLAVLIAGHHTRADDHEALDGSLQQEKDSYRY